MISEDKEQQEKAYRADLQYLKDKVGALTFTQHASPPASLPGCQQMAGSVAAAHTLWASATPWLVLTRLERPRGCSDAWHKWLPWQRTFG